MKLEILFSIQIFILVFAIFNLKKHSSTSWVFNGPSAYFTCPHSFCALIFQFDAFSTPQTARINQNKSVERQRKQPNILDLPVFSCMWPLILSLRWTAAGHHWFHGCSRHSWVNCGNTFIIYFHCHLSNNSSVSLHVEFYRACDPSSLCMAFMITIFCHSPSCIPSDFAQIIKIL